jgi:hypothetical protein
MEKDKPLRDGVVTNVNFCSVAKKLQQLVYQKEMLMRLKSLGALAKNRADAGHSRR